MDVSRIGIAGAGVMGSQIAQVLAVAGYDVCLYDTDETALTRATNRITNDRFGLRSSVAVGKITQSEADAAMARIHMTTDLAAAFDDIDILVEAVPEDFATKARALRAIEEVVPARTVFTSNTGGLSITALAWTTHRPEKVLGWHFSQPVAVMRMAEIAIHKDTEASAIDAVVAASCRLGKNPQVIWDQPEKWGFVANRINREIHREAQRIVNEGICTEEQVNAILKDCFRWPIAPFETEDGSMERSPGAHPSPIPSQRAR